MSLYYIPRSGLGSDQPSGKTKLPAQHSTLNPALYNFVHLQKNIICTVEKKFELYFQFQLVES